MRTKEEIQKEFSAGRTKAERSDISEYRAGYLQALAWVLDEDVL